MKKSQRKKFLHKFAEIKIVFGELPVKRTFVVF